jgi:hypothetical protein
MESNFELLTIMPYGTIQKVGGAGGRRQEAGTREKMFPNYQLPITNYPLPITQDY